MAMNEGYRFWDGICGPRSCLSSKNPPQFGTRLGYLTAKSEALFARILRCAAALEGADSSLTTLYSFHTLTKYVDASKQFDTTTCSIFIAKSPPKLASDWPFSQPKIGIFGRDFVLWLASCKVIGDLDPHVSMTWL